MYQELCKLQNRNRNRKLQFSRAVEVEIERVRQVDFRMENLSAELTQCWIYFRATLDGTVYTLNTDPTE